MFVHKRKKQSITSKQAVCEPRTAKLYQGNITMAEYVAQANALLASKNPFNKSQRLEDAVELLKKGGAQHKIDKEWKLAAETYVQAAAVLQKTEDRDAYELVP